ncbi:MAG: hypothetical protein K0R47_2071 [Brevibacillus sp.]|nr:hypothetical protein [Brevibacillus sp.]
MEVVGQERRGKTISGTEFSVSVYRPTKKILPAERVSFTEDHAALLHEIMQGHREMAAGLEKPKGKSNGFIRSIRDFLHKS